MARKAFATLPWLCVAMMLVPFALAESFAIRTVVAGDSLGGIAQRYRISLELLMEENGLSSSLIHPGDVLRIPFVASVGGPAGVAAGLPPGFRWYTLQAGENLSSVAERFGLGLSAMVGANPDISSLDRLPVGIELLVPPALGMVVTLGHGETILELVERYGVSPGQLARVNGLRSPLDVHPGMMLFLPEVEPVEALARLQQIRAEENRYVWPLHGRLTSYYGARYLGIGTSNFHRGIDIAAPSGTAIGAARIGTVIYAGWSSQGYGNMVKIRHAGGAETWYAHMSSIGVSVGQYVDQGQFIGRVGSTGLSTGPHLHFELHESAGRHVDPLLALR